MATGLPANTNKGSLNKVYNFWEKKPPHLFWQNFFLEKKTPKLLFHKKAKLIWRCFLPPREFWGFLNLIFFFKDFFFFF